MVIVIIQCKVQAELGQAGFVDLAAPGPVQGSRVPAVDRRRIESAHFLGRGRRIEVCQFQGRSAERSLADVNPQLAENIEGVAADRYAIFPNLEYDRLVDSRIRQGSSVEG